MFGAAHRPADHLAAQRRRQEHVHERLAGGGHAGGVELLPELGARLWSVRHRLGDDVDTALGLPFADALLAQPPPIADDELRRGERVEPASSPPRR